jgi:ribosomal protein S18 acetylase RimI-like enzyme
MFDEETWRDRATTCQWFVTSDKDEIVRVVGGLESWPGGPSKLELVGMWVAPSHRGRGIASSLLHCVATWATSEGATTLRLGVREGNEAALLAY